MFKNAILTCAATAALSLALVPQQAMAWGHTGHVIIGELAIKNLPADLPASVLNAAFYVGELAAEADVSKSSGDVATPNSDVHDFERDPGHFVDLDDNGYDLPDASYPEVAALQLQNLLAPNQGRRDFDTLLRTNGSTINEGTQYSGYLPYNMTDQWQQIRKDFAYWRAFTAAIANPATAPSDRDYFQRELVVREHLLRRDVGYWAHFVGDASQPLHVSVHYNGWGNYPNPNGYTTSGIHAAFEGYFVKNFVTKSAVQKLIPAYVSCEQDTGLASCAGIEPRVRTYLGQTLAQVIPLYELTKQLGNGNPWTTTTPTDSQIQFVAARLAAGAAEMRDEIVDAWKSSDTIYVGYPLIKVSDIESGTVVWSRNAFAGD